MQGNIFTKVPAIPCALLIATVVVASCGSSRKITMLKEQNLSANLSLAQDTIPLSRNSVQHVKRDTFKVTNIMGEEMIIMKAVRDEDGSMVAHDVLDAAVVSARFRNVAERHGKVDIKFNITVPQSMRERRWQLRFYPDMYILGDSLRLDPVIITGTDYRKAQLRGYQQYERFLSSIVRDSTRYINMWQLDIFIQRNIPELYAFRSDTTFVSDEKFHSVFGVNEHDAIEHYTNKIARSINNWKKSITPRMWKRYVKVPIVTQGIHLDTVLRSATGDFVYCYTQSVRTRASLRQIDIVLSGEIWEQDKQIYSIPRSEPLSFYISSLASFADQSERYLSRIVERRASANSACYVAFEQGSSDIREDYAHNAEEIGRIRGNIRDLLDNKAFDLDSIVVVSASSPEGSVKFNEALSLKRSRAIASYMGRYVEHVRDSIEREQGFTVDEDGRTVKHKRVRIDFLARSSPENWVMLDALVSEDEVLSAADKRRYADISAVSDPDQRESLLQKEPFYRYLREQLYPKVRTVRFDFYLHRKGMVKDTVHTTEIDSVYMEGVQAIKDRDYQRAVKLLAPYGDYNTAVAYCALDRNLSAKLILESLERTANVNYMLALVLAREGDDQGAVQCYLNSVEQEPSYRFRGNLDPEISELIKRYGLEKLGEEADDFEY